MPSYPWTHLAYGIYLGFEDEPTYRDIYTFDCSLENSLKAVGCQTVYFGGDGHDTGTVLVISESIVTPELYCITMDELPKKDPKWDGQLKQACEILKIDCKPQWILSCSYG